MLTHLLSPPLTPTTHDAWPPPGDTYTAQLCQAKLHQQAALQAATLAERNAAYIKAADTYLGLCQPGHAKHSEHCKSAAACLKQANEYQRAAQVYCRQCQPPEHALGAECYEKVGRAGLGADECAVPGCGCLWCKHVYSMMLRCDCATGPDYIPCYLWPLHRQLVSSNANMLSCHRYKFSTVHSQRCKAM
jgi:hypothetical protein